MLYKYGHSEKNAMQNTLIFLLTKVRNIFYSCNSWQEIYLGDKYLFVFFRRSTLRLYCVTVLLYNVLTRIGALGLNGMI